MMTEIPFGIAEIEGEAVTIAELNFAEVAAFTSFVPNHELLFSLIKSIDFSGVTPPIVTSNEDEQRFITKSMEYGYIPSANDLEVATKVFGDWVTTVAPVGITSLVDKGFLIPASEGSFKTHRSLDSILKILRTPVEHMAYRTSQVSIRNPNATPILRSSLYAIQSYAGDWLVAEHFQAQDYIRFIGIPGGGKLSSNVGSVVADGVNRSIDKLLSSVSGESFRPYSVSLTRSNAHGSNVVALAQMKLDDDGIARWYVPYETNEDFKLLGNHEEKFGNIFSSAPEVAELGSAPYTQVDIRNGDDGWSPIGTSVELIRDTKRFMEATLHSQSDHLPDTIPDFFFDEKGN